MKLGGYHTCSKDRPHIRLFLRFAFGRANTRLELDIHILKKIKLRVSSFDFYRSTSNSHDPTRHKTRTVNSLRIVSEIHSTAFSAT
jgi:hypothetical protein